MLFNDFLLHLLYLLIQISAVHAIMFKSTDDVLQKPIKNALNIQTCAFTEFLLSYTIKLKLEDDHAMKMMFIKEKEVKLRVNCRR